MEDNHDEQHFTERELAGSQASATRRDQLFPLAIFEDLCKMITQPHVWTFLITKS